MAKYILSLAFWPTTDAENQSARSKWGYDKTMKRTQIEGKIQYEIEVGTDTYITESVVSDWKARDPVGRATRVWQVVDATDKTGSKYVLKDAWLEETTPNESDIWDTIHAEVTDSTNDEHKAAFHKYFLQKKTSSKVPRDRSLPPYVRNNQKTIQLWYTPEPISTTRATVPDSSRTHEVGMLTGGTRIRRGVRTFFPREQYRIVWKGPPLTPLLDLRDQPLMHRVIGDVLLCT